MTVKISVFLKLAAVKIENVPNLIFEILKCPQLHSREAILTPLGRVGPLWTPPPLEPVWTYFNAC